MAVNHTPAVHRSVSYCHLHHAQLEILFLPEPAVMLHTAQLSAAACKLIILHLSSLFPCNIWHQTADSTASFLSRVTPGYAMNLFCEPLWSPHLLINFDINWQIPARHPTGETVNYKKKNRKGKLKVGGFCIGGMEWLKKYRWFHTVRCTWGHTHLELENRNNALLLFLHVREWITSDLCVLRNKDCIKSVLQPFADSSNFCHFCNWKATGHLARLWWCKFLNR